MRVCRSLTSISRFALVAALAMGLGIQATSAEGREQRSTVCAGLEPGPTRTVARIIDGETLALDDGTEVRLIGALAARAADAGAEPGRWPPEVAAIAELEAVALAKSVELAFGGERTDRYGRILAHVMWRDGEHRRWLQGHMLEHGLARAYVQAGNHACVAELVAAEAIARSSAGGLWAEAAYAVRPAGAPLALLYRRSSFQVVEGVIERVSQGRHAIYLDFGGGRGALSVSLRRGDRSVLGASADNPKALEGKLVRVRGWIERRSGRFTGPLIDLSAGGLIEVVQQSPEAPPAAASAWEGRRDRLGAWRQPGRSQEGDAKSPSLADADR
jgi:endonuclease YncB( thermonuclease family)